MEDNVVLNMAGFNIKIIFHKTQWAFSYLKLKKEILSHYYGFLSEKKLKKIDYTIHVVEILALPTIIKTPQRYFFDLFEKKKGSHIITFYQISLLQLQLILREILVELLAKNKGFIMHGSASHSQKGALIFTGKNGAGKSTAMTLLKPHFTPLADDSVIIKEIKNKFYLFQTPFIEKNDWVKKSNHKYKIRGIFFLNKAKNFKIEPIINKNKVLNKIIKQLWTNEDQAKIQMKQILSFVGSFNDFYYLFFAKNKKKLLYLFS